MNKYYIISIIILIQVIIIKCNNNNNNDFGDKYDWSTSLEDALITSEEQHKPIMLIIHKSWCGACKSLKPRFSKSDQILQLSKHFIMLNLMDDDEPQGKQYSPDGGYIPRILFISPEGNVMPEFYNELGSAQYKYFYSQVDEIVVTMKKVLNNYKHSSSDENHGEL